MNIPLLNISNTGRNIFLFTRDEKGNQIIKTEDSFFPFFYEPTKEINPKFIGYDGTPLKKVFVSNPGEISEVRSDNSYSSDIKFTTNYLIHGIDTIQKAPIKYMFLDIEVLVDELPEPQYAKYPITSISISNSFTNEIKNWYIEDMSGLDMKEKENNLHRAFIDYIKKEKPDLILIHNAAFDYVYLYNRIKNFAREISPIGAVRGGEEKDVLYPAGISIVDYLIWTKKVKMREQSYALDNLAQKYLNEETWGKTDFSKLNREVQKKNIHDIERMIALEKQFKLIPYFDEVRRMVKCNWEDLYHNSRIVEFLLMEEAKKKNIALPNRKQDDSLEEEFEGAIRDVEAIGLYKDIGKADLSSAYPSMIINFCLDTQNIVNKEDKDTITINDIIFKQNKDALLPTIVKKILTLKYNLGKLKKENPDDKTISTQYDAIKSIVNSTFGVMGNKYFRLYDYRIASTITYLVREVLTYVKTKINTLGLKVVYFDTDSVFYNTKEDITDKLNGFIHDWAISKFSKEDMDLEFAYEGYFTKILILGKCHYYGYIYGKKKPEIKGVEIKRSSSSKFEAKYQEELINKILNGESRENIVSWIESEKQRIKTLSLKEISFPSKINKNSYDRNEPIFVRAYNNSKKLFKTFKVSKGELFHFIFTEFLGYDENKKPIDVIAFQDEKDLQNIKIDYDEVIRRSMQNKTEKIFSAMNWYLPRNANQLSLI